jgi:hypothetical protein
MIDCNPVACKTVSRQQIVPAFAFTKKSPSQPCLTNMLMNQRFRRWHVRDYSDRNSAPACHARIATRWLKKQNFALFWEQRPIDGWLVYTKRLRGWLCSHPHRVVPVAPAMSYSPARSKKSIVLGVTVTKWQAHLLQQNSIHDTTRTNPKKIDEACIFSPPKNRTASIIYHTNPMSFLFT